MNLTGTLEDDGRTLVLVRRFGVPIDDVWASVTESDRLARWFGTWTGDPASGTVLVTMNAEAEPGAPAPFRVDACEPPRLLAVSAEDEYGSWRLSAELTEEDGGTTLTLRQMDADPKTLPDTGPGWEWYLDRLVAAVEGGEPPSLADFDTDYLPLGPGYAVLAQ
ncbi:SRPBCC family protein [Promicromonospora kroppenstedtii]|uniref:SRPBCC family protein n=1 Tax=Promicromonospora kroppenstedtii TaxID=440482 RepID=A0ABW7XNY4_9MICO